MKLAAAATKKASVLLEVIFSIVVMGFALGALPGVYQKLKESNEVARERDYINALEFASSFLGSLPYSSANICKSTYKSNSSLAQIVSGISASANLGEYSFDASARASSDPCNSGGGVSTADSFSLAGALNTAHNWTDVMGRTHTLVLSELFPTLPQDALISQDSCDGVKQLDCRLLSISHGGRTIVSMRAYLGKMGRTKSLYHSYTLAYQSIDPDGFVDVNWGNQLLTESAKHLLAGGNL